MDRALQFDGGVTKKSLTTRSTCRRMGHSHLAETDLSNRAGAEDYMPRVLTKSKPKGR